MNKSRHVVARAAREVADAGWHVLQVDLLGCGDSDGDFADATWGAWLDDLETATTWLSGRCDGPIWLWGLRSGALLAASWLASSGRNMPVAFWQPVVSGAQHLQQFLRIRAMSEIAKSGRAGSVTALRRQLESEGKIEVGGYRLSLALARGLESVDVSILPPDTVVRWFEVSLDDEPTLSPASMHAIGRLQSSGVRVDSAAAPGPAFWQSVELEDAPALRAAFARAFAAR